MSEWTNGYRVTRTWEGRIIPRSLAQKEIDDINRRAGIAGSSYEDAVPPEREPSTSVSITVCATCVVLFVPSVATVEELDTQSDPTKPWKQIVAWSCDRCGFGFAR